MNPFTYQLLRIVGSPFVNFNDSYKINNYELVNLYHYASKNRMSLLYLESLNNVNKLGSLEMEYAQLNRKYAKIEEAINQISMKLNYWGVEYVFFKSIKPYKEVTVDIDILVFGLKYPDVIREMKRSDYVLLGNGPLSTTFRDVKARVDFDVYNEVGVSHIKYLDKDILSNFVGERRLSNGEVVRSLRPEADLLAVIAHSVLKEQMYVLSEYYTTLHYLANMQDENLNSFLSLADECKLRFAIETHLGVTIFLHNEVYGKLPPCLVQIAKKLRMNYFELLLSIKRGFLMPYKYHPITMVKAFLEKTKEEKARRSYASQILNMLNPKFTSSVVDKALHHISRKTY